VTGYVNTMATINGDHRSVLDVKSKANVASEKRHIKTDKSVTARGKGAPKKSEPVVHQSWADVARSKPRGVLKTPLLSLTKR
jgi:hypothetical protein